MTVEVKCSISGLILAKVPDTGNPNFVEPVNNGQLDISDGSSQALAAYNPRSRQRQNVVDVFGNPDGQGGGYFAGQDYISIQVGKTVYVCGLDLTAK